MNQKDDLPVPHANPELGNDDSPDNPERRRVLTGIAAVCNAAIDLSTRLNYRPRPDDPTVAAARRFSNVCATQRDSARTC